MLIMKNTNTVGLGGLLAMAMLATAIFTNINAVGVTPSPAKR